MNTNNLSFNKEFEGLEEVKGTDRDLVKMFILMNVVDIKDIPGITYYKTNNLEIEFYDNPKTSWCVDGEEYINPIHKYKFRVEKDMKMLMPKKNIKELFEEENAE